MGMKDSPSGGANSGKCSPFPSMCSPGLSEEQTTQTQSIGDDYAVRATTMMEDLG